MNCRPGDLALVVGDTFPENACKVVTCIRLLRHRQHSVEADYGPIWLVDIPMVFVHDDLGIVIREPWCPDQALMPINPRDDEALEQLEEICT